MLGMSVSVQIRENTLPLMLSMLALKMTLELVMVKVLPYDMGDLGSYIELLS